MSVVASLIRQARLDANLTQAALAERAGTSQANVAKYEAGRMSPSISTLERLLHAAGFGLQLAATPSPASTNLAGLRARKLRKHRVEIIEAARRHGATNVRIFGSVARGEDGDDSDVDLLVDFDIDRGLVPIAELARELTAMLDERVDVAPLALLKSAIAERARAEAVPL